MYWTCGQCFVFYTWVLVVSNIVIGLYLPDMWSVLCVLFVGGMFKYSYWNERTGQVITIVCSICALIGI